MKEQLGEFFGDLFGTESWPARWFCGTWSEFHGWLYIGSNLAIWAAYFSIPVALAFFALHKKNLPFSKVLWMFVAFILLCGITHFIDALMFWYPIYRVSALALFTTAIVSLSTVGVLLKIMPDIVKLKTPEDFISEINLYKEELDKKSGQMKFMADAMPQIVWQANPKGEITYFNKQAETYTGKTLQSLLNDNVWQLQLHPADKDRFLDAWNNAIKDESVFENESRIQNSEGQFKWHLNRAIPYKSKNGEVLYWMGTSTDVDDQKKTLNSLENTQEELMATNIELTNKNVQLEKTNNDLDNFVYTASHDLKAPIANLQGLFTTLEHDIEDKRETAPLFSMISTSLSRLDDTIKDLTEISKLESKAADDIELVNLEILFKEVMASTVSIPPGADITTNFEILNINFSRKNIRSILYNLLSNSIKYRANNRKLKIQVNSKEEDGIIVISVKDNGLGIKPEYHEKAFMMFKRLHDHVEGTGLGLYIVRKIVDNAGGRIVLVSDEDQGAEFRIYLPEANSGV